MILAAYNDSVYDIVLYVHVIAAFIAMAPAVAHPIMLELEKRRPDPDVPALASRMVGPSRIYAVALVVAGLVGFGMISLSDNVISFGDTWVWLSIVIWLALNGVLHAMMFPAERAMAAGDPAGLARADRIGPILGVLSLVLIFLMVTKPGSGGL